ncbi:MAG: hypothetical protein JWL65_6215 [Gammaproteobacteria bacterium]|nr:hypothetical protein [Gammaproteobacteria bacterium]
MMSFCSNEAVSDRNDLSREQNDIQFVQRTNDPPRGVRSILNGNDRKHGRQATIPKRDEIRIASGQSLAFDGLLS